MMLIDRNLKLSMDFTIISQFLWVSDYNPVEKKMFQFVSEVLCCGILSAKNKSKK